MTWRQAYFTQAQSDYAMFRNCQRLAGVPVCQELHYLQMATEKLAKAFLCSASGDQPPPRVHAALVRFLKITKGQPAIRRRLGYADNYRAYCSYVDSLLDLADRIEKLAPVGGADRENPEYPWAAGDGEVLCPADYTFPQFGRQDLVKFHCLMDALFRVFTCP